MTIVSSLPMYETSSLKNPINRFLDLTILFLLLSLLSYRLLSLNNHGIAWLIALACESWFTFIWIITVSSKWSPVEYKTYPDHLLQRVNELPSVDIFVTTADPILEPPIVTVNTVLSLLAVDYPSHKIACYVSDDACSPLTFYALMEASKFAKLWVPFCKRHNVHVRAPFRYFTNNESCGSTEFEEEWKSMKERYDELCRKTEAAVQNLDPQLRELDGEFVVFSNTKVHNHPSIVKVILENKEGNSDGLPHLIYVSREKRPKHPHHYKAGAMNVLTRVSGVMTNAPFFLNVDCDMFANDPQIVLRAMCLLLGFEKDRDCAYVSCPQKFYDGLKDDPFGNQLIVWNRFLGCGIAGIQGPFYGGTNCFHRRKIIYGSSPDAGNVAAVNGKLIDGKYENHYGKSSELTKSVAETLDESNEKKICCCPSNSLEAAHEVAGCSYEYGTSWGKEIGWRYGSATEDILTGMAIQSKGYKSVYLETDQPPFLGCAPSGGPATLTQMKRWSTGALEILFSNNCPLVLSLMEKLEFRQCLAYLWIMLWGLRSIPELCYAVLPAYCIVTNSNFIPQVEERAIVIPISIFILYNLYTISEYLQAGQSIRAWWNNQRMGRITATSAWLFGFLTVILKLLGLSESVFEVTQKDQTTTDGRFTFNESPIFVSGTTLVLVNLAALIVGVLRFCSGKGSDLGELFCCVWVLLIFSPFVKGLLFCGKGKYGIPLTTIGKSLALASGFFHLCVKTSSVA